jgi:phosphoadenosine phosphosulfate reductase
MMDPIERRKYLALAGLKKHRAKVESAREILRAAAAGRRLVVATSWGKDSIALCQLAIETLGTEAEKVPAFHQHSNAELPGGEHVVEFFRERMHVTTLPGSMTLAEYVEYVRGVGLPHEREKATQQRVVKTLKKDTGEEFCRANGYDVVALGMRIAEKGPRAKLLCARGPTYTMASGFVKTNPLAYWGNADVWAYIVANDLPYNGRIYDAETHDLTRETIRNTGWLSTDGADRGRIAWLAQHFPDRYYELAREFPQVGLYK